MVVSFVSYRPHPRQSSPSCPSVHPSPVFRTHFQVPYPVSPLFATPTKTAGVCTNNFRSGISSPEQAERPLPALPSTQVLSFQILAHSFACPENLTALFSVDSALSVKKHRGVGAGEDEMLTQDRVRISVRTSYFFSSLPPLPMGNSIGSVGGLSAISSSCGKCRRSGSGTFTFDPFRMLMSCRALTTALP